MLTTIILKKFLSYRIYKAFEVLHFKFADCFIIIFFMPTYLKLNRSVVENVIKCLKLPMFTTEDLIYLKVTQFLIMLLLLKNFIYSFIGVYKKKTKVTTGRISFCGLWWA
jgi:hypothetical protein